MSARNAAHFVRNSLACVIQGMGAIHGEPRYTMESVNQHQENMEAHLSTKTTSI